LSERIARRDATNLCHRQSNQQARTRIGLNNAILTSVDDKDWLGHSAQGHSKCFGGSLAQATAIHPTQVVLSTARLVHGSNSCVQAHPTLIVDDIGTSGKPERPAISFTQR
jgi:hypothetical protein